MSMRDGKGGHSMSSFVVGGVICFSLGVIVLQIFSYVFYHLNRRRRSAAAAAPSQRELLAAGRGLDLSDIASLPSFAHRGSSSFDHKAAAAAADAVAMVMAEFECAVCLSAVEEEEMVRLLPNCNHVFHVDCVDMWLYSHTTCPVCRADVRQPTVERMAAAEELHLGSSAWYPV